MYCSCKSKKIALYNMIHEIDRLEKLLVDKEGASSIHIVGDGSVDLTDYYTKTEFNSYLQTEKSKILLIKNLQ